IIRQEIKIMRPTGKTVGQSRYCNRSLFLDGRFCIELTWNVYRRLERQVASTGRRGGLSRAGDRVDISALPISSQGFSSPFRLAAELKVCNSLSFRAL